ncbi:MAG: family 1 glycosylhydrolase, partial [Erysipelotrichaceae bacterium]|nr:family 1 glycosylhydrolase [Erysipelotrichaceae bacterium]
AVDENGEVNDDARIDFLENYLYWIMKAKEEGVNVKGYYVWSNTDLYSWINGYKKRYGLVFVDYEDKNLKRIPKKSYYWYKEYIRKYMENMDN